MRTSNWNGAVAGDTFAGASSGNTLQDSGGWRVTGVAALAYVKACGPVCGWVAGCAGGCRGDYLDVVVWQQVIFIVAFPR